MNASAFSRAELLLTALLAFVLGVTAGLWIAMVVLR